MIYLKKYGLLIASGLISFIMPISQSLLFVGVISMFDWITGILKAKKTNTVSSSKMIRKFYSTIGYFIGIIIAHYVEIYFASEIPIVKAVVAIIALTEIQSVRENIKEISGTDILKPITNLLSKK